MAAWHHRRAMLYLGPQRADTVAHSTRLFSKLICPSISTAPLGIDWIPEMGSKNNFLYSYPGSGLPLGRGNPC